MKWNESRMNWIAALELEEAKLHLFPQNIFFFFFFFVVNILIMYVKYAAAD